MDRSADQARGHLRDPDVARDKFRGALVGGAVGESMAILAARIGRWLPIREIQEPTADEEAPRAPYGAQTALTIALAESLLHVGDLDPDHARATMARHWERGPRRGFDPTTASVLERVSVGEEALDGDDPTDVGAASDAVAPVAAVSLFAGGDAGLAVDLASSAARIIDPGPRTAGAAMTYAAAVSMALTAPADTPIDGRAFVSQLRPWVAPGSLDEQLDRLAGLVDEGGPHEAAARLGGADHRSVSVAAAVCSFLRHPGRVRRALSFAMTATPRNAVTATMTGALLGAHLGEPAMAEVWPGSVDGIARLRALADRFVSRLLLHPVA